MNAYNWELLVDAILHNPPPGALTLYACLTGWLTPALLYIGLGYWWAERKKRKLDRRVLFPVAWVAGLIVSQVAMECANSIWLSNHLSTVMSEEDFFAIPDGPNVSAGWLLIGSGAVLISHVGARRSGLPRRIKNPADLNLLAIG